jgi:hypothetical protein
LPSDKYHPVAVRHESESQESAHCCEDAPYLIFNEMRWKEHPALRARVWTDDVSIPTKGWSADWFGIRRFNLATGEDTVVLTQDILRPSPPQLVTPPWVSDILSVRPDGSGGVCTVGLPTGAHMDYNVYDVSFTEGLVRMVATLPNTFL